MAEEEVTVEVVVAVDTLVVAVDAITVQHFHIQILVDTART